MHEWINTHLLCIEQSINNVLDWEVILGIDVNEFNINSFWVVDTLFLSYLQEIMNNPS
jgi:hypothetical protein